jgi:hypothetical protein
VPAREAIETKDALSALREVVRRRAAVRTESDDDCVRHVGNCPLRRVRPHNVRLRWRY